MQEDLILEALVKLFILMVQNRATERGQKILESYNRKEMRDLETDLKLAEKGDRKQQELLREIRKIQEAIAQIGKKMKDK